MPNREESKDRIQSEIQALEACVRRAQELQSHFGDGSWDERVTSLANGYHDSLEQCGALLSSLLDEVVKLPEPEPTPGFDYERFAALLDEGGRRMERAYEIQAEQVAIAQKEQSRQMAVAQEELAKQMAAAQEELGDRLAAAQDAVQRENRQLFRDLADHVRESGRVSGQVTHSDPVRSPVQPEDNRDDELPESPDPWSKS
ncbi:hypothetical protein [Nonomuraea sp. KM88]|uniref:hypothetical protein n=1 Tax=Nonomuraea sp. KM88 TaxID=3457427 RepID=UPI003FCE1172